MTSARAALGTLVVAACSFGLLAPACGDDPSPASPGGGDASTSATGGAGGSSSDGGAGGTAPVEYTAAAQCPNAPLVPNAPDGLVAEGELPSGERHYFRTFMPRTWTSIVDGSAGGDLNTVLRVYNEEGTELLATGDDHRPRYRDTFDTWLYFWAPAADTYCIEVLSAQDWRGVSDKGGDERDYRLRVLRVDSPWASNEGFLQQDKGSNDTVATAQIIESAGALITGTLSSPTDRDVYAVPAGMDSTLRRFVFSSPTGPGAPGVEGWGAGSPARVSIVDTDGVTVLSSHRPLDLGASCDGPRLCGSEIPETTPGAMRYIVVEADPDAPLPENNRYSILTLVLGYLDVNAEPAEDGTNDVQTAAVTPPNLSPNVDGFSGYTIEGRLEEGDVDWWHIPAAEEGDIVGVWCGSNLWGSGVQGFQVDAVESDDPLATVVQTEVESTSKPLRWGPLDDGFRFIPSQPALSGGVAYDLKISASGQDPFNTGRDYFCRVNYQPGVER